MGPYCYRDLGRRRVSPCRRQDKGEDGEARPHRLLSSMLYWTNRGEVIFMSPTIDKRSKIGAPRVKIYVGAWGIQGVTPSCHTCFGACTLQCPILCNSCPVSRQEANTEQDLTPPHTLTGKDSSPATVLPLQLRSNKKRYCLSTQVVPSPKKLFTVSPQNESTRKAELCISISLQDSLDCRLDKELEHKFKYKQLATKRKGLW